MQDVLNTSLPPKTASGRLSTSFSSDGGNEPFKSLGSAQASRAPRSSGGRRQATVGPQGYSIMAEQEGCSHCREQGMTFHNHTVDECGHVHPVLKGQGKFDGGDFHGRQRVWGLNHRDRARDYPRSSAPSRDYSRSNSRDFSRSRSRSRPREPARARSYSRPRESRREPARDCSHSRPRESRREPARDRSHSRARSPSIFASQANAEAIANLTKVLQAQSEDIKKLVHQKSDE
jgi:hypothetical protein